MKELYTMKHPVLKLDPNTNRSLQFFGYTGLPDSAAEIQNSTRNIHNFKLYPNPTDGNITLKYQLVGIPTARLELYDMNGKQLLTLQLLANTNTQTFLYGDLLASGMYLVKIYAPDGQPIFNQRVVVSKQ